MATYELIPDGARKSFYGKAKVTVDNDGTATLYSYGTPILRKNTDGTFTRIWDGWSVMTGRHIKAFCGMNKEMFTNFEVGV